MKDSCVNENVLRFSNKSTDYFREANDIRWIVFVRELNRCVLCALTRQLLIHFIVEFIIEFIV